MAVPLFDAHCDTAYTMDISGQALRENGLHTDLKRARAHFSPYAQVFAVWWDPQKEPEAAFNRIAPLILAQIRENSDICTLCTTAAQARAAVERGFVSAAFLAVEGCDLIGCSLEGLHRAYDLGFRFFNLTWNSDNRLAGAALGEKKYGLTAFGHRFVKEAQDLGCALDVSHVSETAFWDLTAVAEKPVIASHSNAKALCDHPRNLTDDQFRELARIGGAVGVNLCPDFLGLGRDVGAVCEHILHFLSLGGARTVCIGTDFDGIDEMPRGITGIQDLGAVYEALLRLNLSESLVRDLFYENLMAVLEGIL